MRSLNRRMRLLASRLTAVSKVVQDGASAVRWALARSVIGLVRAYRYCLSPWLGHCCRFFPSCSTYAEEAFRQHGVCMGVYLTLRRLLKCHPWHPGGVDLVPDKPIVQSCQCERELCKKIN